MNNLQKTKRIRLHGRALAALNAEVHDRDNDCCIFCGEGVDPGEKFHHYPQGADKQDRKECAVTACGKCHDLAHFSELVQEFKDKCESYLRKLYPEFWEG